MAGFWQFLIRLFSFDKENKKEYKTADIFRDLRQQVLTVDPAKMGFASTESNKVWGMLIESGYTQGIVSLVTLADSTVSVYYSNGGALIGLGADEGIRKTCTSLLAFAPTFLSYTEPTKDYPLPKKGNTRFYFITCGGILTVEANENDLGNNLLPLSPLFHKAHEIITEALSSHKKLLEQKKGQ